MFRCRPACARNWSSAPRNAGKHILCEKPCAASLAELDEMLAACRKNSVQFMDGVMFMHSPRLPKIREVLDDGKSLGQIQRMSSAFSFYSGDDFFQQQHPRGRRARTRRLPRRSRLVFHPFFAVDAELAIAAHGHRPKFSRNPPHAGPRRRNFPPNCFLTAAFRRNFTVRFSPPSSNGCPSAASNGWLRLPDFVHPRNSYEPAFEVNGTEVRAESGREMSAGCRSRRLTATPPRRTRGCGAILRTRFSPAS